MHKLDNKWIIKILNYWKKADEYYGYYPIKTKDLKAVCFESRSPIDSKHSEEKTFQVTEWVNNEGFELSIHTFNTLTKTNTSKLMSFSNDDIDGFLSCLLDLEYFKE